MEMKQRILVTAEHEYTRPAGMDICCDDCGGVCCELFELLSKNERGALISSFKAARRRQINSGELQALVGGPRS